MNNFVIADVLSTCLYFPSVQDQGIEMRVIEEGTHHSLLHRPEHISERNT